MPTAVVEEPPKTTTAPTAAETARPEAAAKITKSEPAVVSGEKDKPTPWFLQPRMPEKSEEPEPIVREPAVYRSLYMLDTLGVPNSTPSELTGPIDPFDDADEASQGNATASSPNVAAPAQVQQQPGSPSKDAATTQPQTGSPPKVKATGQLAPAVGLLTVHEQSWEQRGLALGNLLQSICLAPGEVTQIAITRWERGTRGVSTELTEQAEAVSSQAEQDRAVNEVQRSVAQEQQWGTSSSSASSTSSRAGVSYGLFGLGASASTATTNTSVLTAQFSAGNRNLQAESTNQVSQRTAEHSQALRSRRQSVIREVTEQESETLTTRVLANYNRRHTLNILFFEVLQLYRTRTTLKDWERCLFVPMTPIDFVKDCGAALAKHRAQLLSFFAELGATEAIERLDKALESHEAEYAKDKRNDYDTQIGIVEKARDAAREYDRLTLEICTWSNEIQECKKRIEDYELGPPAAYRETLLNQAETEKKQKEEKIASNNELAARKKAEFQSLASQVPHLRLGGALHAATFARALEELKAQRAAVTLPFCELLNKDRLFFSQQLWLRMTPYRIFRVLQNYTLPPENNNQTSTPLPLSAVLDPKPVGVFGNYLAFRWRFSNDEQGAQDRKKFEKQYLSADSHEVKDVVGLPTSGIFAEAVLGQGLAAEQVDARFGKWKDKDNQIPILPPKIAALQSRDRHHDMDFTAQDFSSSLAQLRAEKLEDISHIDQVLTAVGKSDLFRNMGGLEQALNLATKLGELSAAGAKEAADKATEIQEKILDTFKEVLDSDVGKAAVAEFMAPGSGAAMLGAKKNGGGAKTDTAPEKAT